MAEREGPADLQDAVERSYRAQWGGRRFYLSTAVALFVLAVIAGIVLVIAPKWFGLDGAALKVVELACIVTSFVCLIGGVLALVESITRLQRERGQLPDRTIHAALSLSTITVAGLVYYFFLAELPWNKIGFPEQGLIDVIKVIVFLFCGLAWLASVGMSSAGITMLLTRRSDLLEVNNTNEGTAFVFRKGHSSELVKLSIATLIPFILFVVAMMMAVAIM